MKIRDLFDDIQNPEYSVYDYISNNIDFSQDEREINNLPKVLQVVYIVHRFIDEINSGGLDYYYDVFAPYKELSDCLKAINDTNVLKLINESDKIINNVEKRIGKAITDNIEYINEDESDILQEINSKYYNYEDDLIEKLRKYVIENGNIEI